MKPSATNPTHMLLAMLLAAPLAMLATCSAKASPPCRVCRQQVVHQAAVVAAPVYSTPYYAEVAPQLQQEAAATYAFRGSREYDELIELRGYVRAVQERNAAEAAKATPPPAEQPPSPAYSTDAAEPVADAEPVAAALPAEALAEPADDSPITLAEIEAVAPTLAAKCATCHIKPATEANQHLSLAAPLSFDQRMAMAFSVHEGTMPKNGPELSPADKLRIYRELFPE